MKTGLITCAAIWTKNRSLMEKFNSYIASEEFKELTPRGTFEPGQIQRIFSTMKINGTPNRKLVDYGIFDKIFTVHSADFIFKKIKKEHPEIKDVLDLKDPKVSEAIRSFVNCCGPDEPKKECLNCLNCYTPGPTNPENGQPNIFINEMLKNDTVTSEFWEGLED
jgi:hypothetical protein